MQRRKSFKDVFIRKASGDSRRNSQDTDGAVIATAVTDATNNNRRKPNSRLNRGNITLTTSSLFKNLMKGAIVLDDEEAPQSATRRATVADMAVDEGGEGLACNSKPPCNKRKPRRNNRRATVDTGKLSPAMMKELRSGHCAERSKIYSNGSTPSASFVMKNAFAQLMEEKNGLSRDL